ncbi:polysaccharide biosynthesis/export family protein [Ramlibacter sp. XY19]|uniref:polysaccharide biosynthesis/export family protein n=1 Tax=Ramlibacter paludis TaxID=2908000 RepID=UPI0023DA0FB9|nr:polysaccharide biosynthesis/export family protein [Ramlibacter paludis]
MVTAPGFDFADPSTRSSITLGQYVPADPANPPQGVVIPITPMLIQAEWKALPTGISPDVARLFAEPKPYTIGPSDIITVVVYDHPELLPAAGAVISQQVDPTGIASAPGFIVDSRGEIFFPYAGRIHVGGLTESEAGERVRASIARVIKDPQVTVRINSFRSRRAYVDGEVRLPGSQIFTDVPMTLPEAINRAGGVTPNGDRSFVTLTRGNTTTVIDLLRLQEAGVNPNRIVLESGDLVSVRHREERKVFVMGEILRPSALLMRSGRMTLNEALAEAGGPNLTTANTDQIYVIRSNREAAPTIYHLKAGSPVALALAESFPLRPRDVVYIDPVPLVQWNRIINLIVPSAQTLTYGRQIISP